MDTAAECDIADFDPFAARLARISNFLAAVPSPVVLSAKHQVHLVRHALCVAAHVSREDAASHTPFVRRVLHAREVFEKTLRDATNQHLVSTALGRATTQTAENMQPAHHEHYHHLLDRGELDRSCNLPGLRRKQQLRAGLPSLALMCTTPFDRNRLKRVLRDRRRRLPHRPLPQLRIERTPGSRAQVVHQRREPPDLVHRTRLQDVPLHRPASGHEGKCVCASLLGSFDPAALVGSPARAPSGVSTVYSPEYRTSTSRGVHKVGTSISIRVPRSSVLVRATSMSRDVIRIVYTA